MLIFGQAQDEDIIRRKVLEKVATFTTWSALSCLHQEDSAEHTDSDQLLVNNSDVDSSGDAVVTVQSVDGEDDMVDVSMQDIAQGDAASHQEAERYVAVVITPSIQALIGTKISRNPQEIQPPAPGLDQT